MSNAAEPGGPARMGNKVGEGLPLFCSPKVKRAFFLLQLMTCVRPLGGS